MSAEDEAIYRAAFEEAGEIVSLRRESATGAAVEAEGLLARAVGFTAEELAAGIDQGLRKVLLLADDVEAAVAAGVWPAPLFGRPAVIHGDIIVLRGAPLNVESVDDSTRRVAGALMAYEITALG